MVKMENYKREEDKRETTRPPHLDQVQIHNSSYVVERVTKLKRSLLSTEPCSVMGSAQTLASTLYLTLAFLSLGVGIDGVRAAMTCDAPLVVLGASMVDVGENAVAQPMASTSEYPPYGVDYFGRPAARYSNGRLFIDFISQELGYGLLDPYLDSVAATFAHGVNFASSGSTARNLTRTASPSDSSGLFSLAVQVKQYKLFRAKFERAQNKHKGSLKTLPTMNRFTKAIHFIETAHNDYITTFLNVPNYDAQSLVTAVMSSMEDAIRGLHSDGAMNIIVMNVFPLGCTPLFLAYSNGSMELDSDACVASYNKVVDMHNSHLQQLINQMRTELSLNGLVVFDANALYYDALRNPSKYGLKYPYATCCGVGGGKYNLDFLVQCGKTGMVGGKLTYVGRCSSPADYISWDGLHPTESFGKHMAYGVLSGRFLTPSSSLSIQNICMA